ncbi:hypothetical protein TIFTF001_032578 [Ficus carica]|uniref:Uncharacterized protein n=1 Tax=Ficus carica TaxID=3494 RepID=A0AA88E3P6_FICCA|nr:hypothetical protein TIFTF001_032578 [Ficus carica]
MNGKEKKKEECFSYMTGESLHLELHQLCSVVFADDMMNLCNFAESLRDSLVLWCRTLMFSIIFPSTMVPKIGEIHDG